MRTYAPSATLAGWKTRVIGVMRPAVVTRRIPLSEAPRRGGASNAVAAKGDARTAEAAEAIRRSPLGLDLPSNHPGLALVARKLEEDEISEAAVRLVREHGLMTAKAMIAEDPTVLSRPSQEDVALFKALQPDGGSRRPRVANTPAGAADAIARSPLMMQLPADYPGLAAVAALPDDMVIAACVHVMREHGLFDAKHVVAEDVTVLLTAAKEVEKRLEAEAAVAAAEAAAAAAEAGPEAAAHVVDALKRSPLMLELPANAPGLAEVSGLLDDQIIGAAVYLMRQHGMFDAKALVAADPSILLPAAREANRIAVEEAAARLAELAEAEAAAAEEYVPAAPAPAPVSAPVPARFAHIVDALKRSPLMMEVSAGANGLEAVASLSDEEIIGAAVVLLREHGFMDAKAMIAADLKVLVPAVGVAKAKWAQEAAERAAELAAAEAEFAEAFVPVSSAFAHVADALKRSPLMLDVPAGTPGLEAAAKLSEEEIVGAAVALLREHGLLDAKALVAADLKVLVPAAEVAKAKWAAEAAERAAELAAAEAGSYGAALDALKRSPLMLELDAAAPGLEAIADLSDRQIIGAAVVLLREHGLLDAKALVAADLSVLVPAAAKAQAIWEAEEAERAAELAASELPPGWGPRDLVDAAAAPVTSPVPVAFAAAADAIRRSPLMLEVGGSAPGLAEVAKLSDEEIIGAAVVLLREHGLMDAKAMVAADLKVLVPAAEVAKAKWAVEAAERAAELAAAEAGPYGAALDAVKRSPLMLDVPADAPGLEAVSALSDEEIIGAAVVLLRQHGLLDAKALVAADLSVLIPAAEVAKAKWAAEAAERAAEQAAAEAGPYGAALDAVKRSPLMLDVPANAPGLEAIAELSDDQIIGATVVLLRQHGLLDAKALVAADLSVLVPAAREADRLAAEEAAARLAELAEAEAAAASEAAVEEYVPAAAAAPIAAAPALVGEAARVLSAIKGSPLMLDLPANSPGVAVVAALDDAMINAACVLLMRVEGMFDAKDLIRKDASILLDVAKEVERIEAEEAAARAAELAEAEAAAAAEAAGEEYVPAAAVPSGDVAHAIAAIKRSPLMMELPANSPGLAAAATLPEDMIVAACVLLLRVEGLFDAKEMIRADASILLDVAKEVERIEAEEAATRSAEEAERLATEAAEAEAEAPAAAPAAAPAKSVPISSAFAAAAPIAAALSGTGRVLSAIKGSPLMLDLPASTPGLAEVAALDDAMINAACVLLMRVEGMFDAKDLIRQDASILLDVAKEVERIEAEEAAARAAEEAERLAAEAAAAEAAEGAPVAAPVYAAPAAIPAVPVRATGEVARVLSAIKGSPLMLELPANSPGVAAVTALDDAMINAACVLLMRVEGMFDAKEMLRQDASLLLDVAKEVERIEAEEAAARAAELAEAEAAAAAEAAGEEYVPGAAAAAVPAHVATPSDEVARVLSAIKGSPLMLELPATHRGLAEVAALDDAMINASCVLLMRVEGMFDAKNMLRDDVTILLDVAKEVERIEAEEAAARAAELAEAEAAEAAEAMPVTAAAAVAPAASSAEAERVADALKRSPLMLDVPYTAAGLMAVTGLRDDDIIDSVLVMVRQYGLLDAKDIIRSNAAVLNDAFKVVVQQREAAAAEAAAEAAAAAAAAEEEERVALGAMSNGRHH